MKRKYLLLSCFITILSFVASANTGEENAKKSDVVGGVFTLDSKKPLGNVSVTAYSNAKKEKVILTDSHGNYSFNDLKPGMTYRFVFEKEGYKKVIKEKYIARVDEAQQLNIQMEEHASFDFMPGPSQFFDF
jgi:hypothetical protein